MPADNGHAAPNARSPCEKIDGRYLKKNEKIDSNTAVEPFYLKDSGQWPVDSDQRPVVRSQFCPLTTICTGNPVGQPGPLGTRRRPQEYGVLAMVRHDPVVIVNARHAGGGQDDALIRRNVRRYAIQ